jgi:hypothetical protein
VKIGSRKAYPSYVIPPRTRDLLEEMFPARELGGPEIDL